MRTLVTVFPRLVIAHFNEVMNISRVMGQLLIQPEKVEVLYA